MSCVGMYEPCLRRPGFVSVRDNASTTIDAHHEGALARKDSGERAVTAANIEHAPLLDIADKRQELTPEPLFQGNARRGPSALLCSAHNARS